MKTGQILGEDIATYHQTDAFSSTKLKVFRKLPALYKAMYLDKTVPPRVPTAALDVGKALDHLLLDGVEAYEKYVYVLPETYRPNAKEDKALIAAKEAAGMTVLTQKESGLVEEMAQAVFRHDVAKALLENGGPGVTWRADFGFAYGQARTDWWNARGATLPGVGDIGPYWVELKTCASLNSADFINFSEEYYNRDYHLQIAFYYEVMREILGVNAQFRPLFIVVDKSAIPYCQVFDPLKTEAGRMQFNLARQKVMRDVERLKTCYETGNFPGLPGGILSLEIPSWQEKKLIEEIG